MTAILLPAFVAAAIVWLAGSVIHMLLPHHKADYVRTPDQNAVRTALKGIQPGQYLIPAPAKLGDWSDETVVAEAKEGPVGILVVGPSGTPNMGRLLSLHFLYCLVISLLVGYVAYASIGPGADYLTTFQVTATVAVLAYAGSQFSSVIWYFYKPSYAFKYLFDGVIYGLLTGGVFGWLY